MESSLARVLMLLLLLISFVLASDTTFEDSSCKKLKCSRSEMIQVNRAKMFALGDHLCTDTYIKFNPNGTIQSTVSFPSTVNSFYNHLTGALHSQYVAPGANVSIDEYCDGNGKVCIDIQGSSNSGYYTESQDQNKGGLGTVWRAIGYYEPDHKAIKGVQVIVPASFGDILFITFLDANNKLDYSVYQTCTKLV